MLAVFSHRVVLTGGKFFALDRPFVVTVFLSDSSIYRELINMIDNSKAIVLVFWMHILGTGSSFHVFYHSTANWAFNSSEVRGCG
jgi:hypothetical protein